MLIFATTASFAQLRKDRTLADIGGYGAIDNGDGTFKMAFNFNSTKVYGSKFSDNSFKALQSIFLATEAPNGMVDAIYGTKTNRIGSGANGYRLKGLTELLNFSVVDTLKAYNSVQSHWKQVAAILDVVEGDTTDGVWVNYPGMYKKGLLAFRANLTNIGVIGSDLSFELMTYDKGNTSKTAQYKMIVELGGKINNGFGNSGFKTVADFDTITNANNAGIKTALGTQEIYVVDTVYTTTTDGLRTKVKINVAQAIGKTKEEINGKYVAVMLYTKGTGTNIAPGVYEPVLGIDNIEVTYVPASWVAPAGAITNAYINHNNGAPATTESTDFTGGTPVPVIADIASPIKMYLTSLNRTVPIVITEDNTDNFHNAKFEFAATGAVKAKDAAGNYTVDVPYVLTPSDGTSEYNVSIALPAGQSFSNDTLEVSINATVADQATSATRLEITNGTRFWYNVSAAGTALTAAPAQQVKALAIYDLDRTIVAKNASSDVTIVNAAGQVVKVVSATAASKGIAVAEGAYVVKTGNTIQKVIVK